MKIVKGWALPDYDTHFLNTIGNYPTTWYQQNSLDLALSLVSNFEQCIDIGANIGLHSVRLSNKFNQVVSFEPAYDNYKCLERNTYLLNVKAFNCALGDRSMIGTISLPVNSKSCGGFSMKDFVGTSNKLHNEQVRIKCLDEFDLSPDLIKIDTQGFEVEVLRGGKETIQKHKPVILIETFGIQKNLIFKTLRQFNYKPAIKNFKSKDTIWLAS